MRGKPKGISRKQAHSAKGTDKSDLCRLGALAEFPERAAYDKIKLISASILQRKTGEEIGNSSLPSLRDVLPVDIQEAGLQLLISAILNNDAASFDRMSKLAQWYRAGQPVADPTGWKVLIVASHMEGTYGEAVTARAVIRHLDHFWPAPNSYDEGDIRRIIRELGLSKSGGGN